jgi:hypothetical protein
MERYWFTFKEFGFGTALNLGCGVTAWTLADAINLLNQSVFKGAPYELDRVELCKSLDMLEENHVRPNIGNVHARGIWFPMGYESR